eukprot:Hpha_TRINITY_DN11380_c0_g1::TRINITY_DN11380_c0_g1_i1::g.63192::m.63192/K05712/mhpA; 3-(3-hydroxy-phenyl)propionate hydroxylase
MADPSPSTHDYDVVIVGYGPTGAVLAKLLGGDGVRVLVLERAAAPYPLPRAVHFDDETMRVFQAAGCAEEIVGVTRINPGMKFVNPSGELLLDWPRPQVVTSNGWNASFRFHQPDVERILHRRVAEELSGTVTVVWGAKVTSIIDNGDSVAVHYTPTGTPPNFCVTAKYAVGCDGANSRTRRSLAAGLSGSPNQAPPGAELTDEEDNMEDLGFRERWLVVDVLLRREMPHLGDHTVQTCNPVRPTTYTRQPGDRRRWELAVLPDETDATVTDPDWVWDFIGSGPRGVTRDDAELERSALYTFKSRVANTWVKGRVAIAGDAAHLTPPFMGQGMCAGVRDAGNLAWKLALCVKRGHNPALFESYGRERRPHVRAYIEMAIRLGALMNTCETAAELRNCLQPGAKREEGADGSAGPAKMESIKPPIGDALGVGPAANRLCPQPQLAGGEWLDNVVGYTPVLIIDPEFRGAVAEGVAALERCGVKLLSAADDPAIAAALENVGGRAVLVRPDRYVLGAAGTAAEFEPVVQAGLSIWEGCGAGAN